MKLTKRLKVASPRNRAFLIAGIAVLVLALGGVLFVAAKMRPIAAPIVSAVEPRSSETSELELAVLIPQRCEKGEILVRYVERASGISVKAQYRRKSILPPTEFECTLELRRFGSIVRVAIDSSPRMNAGSSKSVSRPKLIADQSQSVARPVVYVRAFSSDFEEPFGPGLDVKIERVSRLD